LKGVGPKRAAALGRLGIVVVRDLLFHFPRHHEDRRVVPLRALRPGTPAAVRGTVRSFEVSSVGRDLSLGRALLDDGTGTVEAVWFRRRSFKFDAFQSLRTQVTMGASLAVYGGVEWGGRAIQIRVEEQEPGDAGLHIGRWTPVYDLTEGIEARWLRGHIREIVHRWAGEVPDPLPAALRAERGLEGLAESLRGLHFPSDEAERDRARRRLAFDEFFLLELALADVRRRRAVGPPAAPCRPSRVLLSPFRDRLGFDFTPAQKRVINEIFGDMAGEKPMSRLLLGEVGSGKTAVAVSAMLLAVENGLQAALMAPTEILAEQHAVSLRRFLGDLPVRSVLISGRLTVKERAARLAELREGRAQIAVGTHALLENDVAFQRLGLVIVDEQHRFGVRQRATLQGKALSPHALILTATPIPRTLALTVYGDLSVSIIDQLPPGRPGITTRWGSEGEALAAVRRAVAEGRQAFIVFPLVEDSERMDLRAVQSGWERLSRDIFPDLSVGLLHGKMKSAEKEEVMTRFVRGELHVLAATPVIEVGIDVPNATVMVILNAERFGVAQLHQLRGRVGRGRHASHCFLVSHVRAGDSAERLRLLCQQSNGFRLAEEDLKRRGPGEILGEAQHGLPMFKAGNLVTDGPIIEDARAAAEALLEEDKELLRPEHAPLRRFLQDRFGPSRNLGRVG
jgi:ATP-dependent DNA helicase RecG